MLATSSPSYTVKILRNSLFFLAFFATVSQLSAQTTIWLENFSGANQGWTANFVDCDGTAASFNGVRNSRYELTDMEGAPCCVAGGGGGNEWLTNPITISNYCNVSISVDYGFIGTFECSAGGPYLTCTGNVAIDNGHDQIIFEYRINGGAWVQFAYVCGGQTGTATVGGLTGNTIEVRLTPSNKATAETYWFDNVSVVGTLPVVNQPANIVVCAGQTVSNTFTGTASTTFNWTNNNTATGLPAAGTGNINTPSAMVTSQQISTITVTPTIGSCNGVPKTFTVTVNPAATVSQPANVAACGGDMVNVAFSGTASGFTWTNSNPAIGLGASGNGNLGFPAANVTTTQTATITVTPTGTCPGPPVTFTITVNPVPTANQPANVAACGGDMVNVAFSGMATGFNWTNSNPAIGLGASGNGSLGFPAANVTATETATITLTPTGLCPGTPVSFTITIDPVATVNQPADVVVCEDEPISVAFAGTASGFNWTNSNPAIGLGAAGTGNINFTPANVTTTETATITVTPTGLCPGSPVSFAITINPLPVASVSGDMMICSGESTTLTASGGSDYLWNTGEQTASITVMPSTTTTYLVAVSTLESCSSTTSATVIVNDASGTTLLQTSCDPANVGTSTQILTNYLGCDSAVTTITTLLPESNTSLTATTCNPANVGTTTQILINYLGCDSTIVTTTTLSPSSMTNLTATTCNPANVGITTQILINYLGCDSTVVTTTTLSQPR